MTGQNIWQAARDAKVARDAFVVQVRKCNHLLGPPDAPIPDSGLTREQIEQLAEVISTAGKLSAATATLVRMVLGD
jgi:uncharacterized protein YjiS (DUF1127 family)